MIIQDLSIYFDSDFRDAVFVAANSLRRSESRHKSNYNPWATFAFHRVFVFDLDKNNFSDAALKKPFSVFDVRDSVI